MDVEGVELAGREVLAPLHGQTHGRVEPEALPVGRGQHQLKGQAVGHGHPERAQGSAGACASACHQAMRQHHGVHRARAGAADAVQVKPAVFQQRVEHPPGERAVCATALQRQIQTVGVWAPGQFHGAAFSVGGARGAPSRPRPGYAGRGRSDPSRCRHRSRSRRVAAPDRPRCPGGLRADGFRS